MSEANSEKTVGPPSDVLILSACRTPIGAYRKSLSSVPAATLGSIVIREAVHRASPFFAAVPTEKQENDSNNNNTHTHAPHQNGRHHSSCGGQSEADQQRVCVSSVIMGQTLTAGCGQNPARQAAILAGLRVSSKQKHELTREKEEDLAEEEGGVPASTVNMVCGSGLLAVCNAFDKIRSEAIDQPACECVVVAGGQENMSMAPLLVTPLTAASPTAAFTADKSKSGGEQDTAASPPPPRDHMMWDGLSCCLTAHPAAHTNTHAQAEPVPMGNTAENLAVRFGISREQQDAFALRSQHAYRDALQAGWLRDEIVPVCAGVQQQPITVEQDEHPRPSTNAAGLAKLRPLFQPTIHQQEQPQQTQQAQQSPTVTAGNASGRNDGAAALLLCSASHPRLAIGSEQQPESQPQPLGRIVAWAQSACDPAVMGLGPVQAIRRALHKARWTLDDVHLWEINEAFAAQILAVIGQLRNTSSGEFPLERLNCGGGAIALGHPIGASGARILVTLLHGLKRLQLKRREGGGGGKAGPLRGVAATCVGGGMGIAICVETLD